MKNGDHNTGVRDGPKKFFNGKKITLKKKIIRTKKKKIILSKNFMKNLKKYLIKNLKNNALLKNLI